jgi:hypothetical protein
MSSYHRFVIIPTILMSLLTFVGACLNHVERTVPAWLALSAVVGSSYAIIGWVLNEVRGAQRDTNWTECSLSWMFGLALVWNIAVVIRLYFLW